MKEKYHFPSADGQTTIMGSIWKPEGEPKAVLQITHGMVEYIDRYEEFANFLNTQGFVVFGHDHIGHGDSVKSPAEWGIMHAKHPADVMVADMYTDYCRGKEMYPDLPYFMLGHSMGSYMLRKLLSEHAGDLKGLNGAVIMGTGTVPSGTLKAGLMVMKLIALFKGWDYRSSLVAGLMYDSNYKQFSTDGSEPEKSWLSKNLENVKAYYRDPKCTYMFSLNGYRGLVESVIYDNDPEHVKLTDPDLPLLITSGEDDPVGGLKKGVTEAYEKYRAAGIKDVTLKLYPNLRHEILNEPERDMVYRDILNWMEKRM